MKYQSEIMVTFALLLCLSLTLAIFCIRGRSIFVGLQPRQFGTANLLLLVTGMGLIFAYGFGWVIPHWANISRFFGDLWSLL